MPMASSESPSSSTSASNPRYSLIRHAFVFLLGPISVKPEQLAVFAAHRARWKYITATFGEVAMGYSLNSGESITSNAGSMHLDAAAHDAVKPGVLEPVAFVDVRGTGAFVAILVIGSVDLVFNANLVFLDFADVAEPAGATLPAETKAEAANTVHQAVKICAPAMPLLLNAHVKLNTGATSISAPPETVSHSLFLSSGGFFVWWIANVASWLFCEQDGLGSWGWMSMSALDWQSVLMIGSDDMSSLLHFQSKPAASRLNKLSGIKHKEISIAVLNSIRNHRGSDDHVDAVIRVDHHRSPRPVSLSPRFDDSSHVHPCLSPAKRTKNPRLNASQPRVPSPIKQPERPPASLSVGTEEDFGCHRRGCSKDLFAIVTTGLRRVHPLLLCVVLEFRLRWMLPCLTYGVESQGLLLCSTIRSHIQDSSLVAKKLHLCHLRINSSRLVLWLLK